MIMLLHQQSLSRLLCILLLLAAAAGASWAFSPAPSVPTHNIRHGRIRSWVQLCGLQKEEQETQHQQQFVDTEDTQMTTKTSAASTTSNNAIVNNRNRHYQKLLLRRFQGDFDNYNQVVSDRQCGLLPKKGGGHEHIHCTLIPVSKQTRLAAFYFDGLPNAIFRFRFYEFVLVNDNDDDNDNDDNDGDAVVVAETVLYTLSPELEGKLRQCKDPSSWPDIFRDHVLLMAGDSNNKNIAAASAADGGSSSSSLITQIAKEQASIVLLPDCEVHWTWEPCPIQHGYVESSSNNNNKDGKEEDGDNDDADDDDGIHAVMVHGEALVPSQMLPGQNILIRDQLSLYENKFLIHDRGYDPDTMDFIYGNQMGIPYVLDRVCYDRHNNDKENFANPDLAWTLGDDYRTEDEYQRNMKAIGGGSRPSKTNDNKK